MNLEEKSIGDAIRATGSRLSHFHACENDRGAPGSGHVPWDEVADALHAIDFAGPVVIESFTDQVVDDRRGCRRLAPGRRQPGTTLAADGGAFLRGAARMTGLRELRPFGHSSWSAPFHDSSTMRLSSAEAAPLTIAELGAIAGISVEAMLRDVPLGYGPSGGSLRCATGDRAPPCPASAPTASS